MTKQELSAAIKDRCDKVEAIFNKMDEEGRPGLTKDEAGDVKTLSVEAEKFDEQLKGLLEMDAARETNKARKAAYEQIIRQVPFQAGNQPESRGDAAAQAMKTLGEQLQDHDAFKAWHTNLVRGGQISRAQFGASPSVQFDGIKALNSLKALLTGASSTSAGALVTNDRLGIVDMGTFARPLSIRQLVTNGQTGSDAVEYVRQGTHTNAAAPVAEATATSGSSGSKPESTMVLSVETETVKTIAHWIPASRRALADAPQLRTLIDQFLRYGLEEELEDQMINGSGSGENFTGISNVSGITAQAWDTNILTTTRKARTKVRITGRATPNGYGLHPTDWETLDLLQDNEARYYFGGPTVMGTPRLWGLPVAESEAFTQGTGYVADWRLAVLWDREMANILVSDSHSDFFTRNMIAILAELRAAFGVIRPAAFVEMDLTA